MGLTIEALFAQPDNTAVLRYLKLFRPEDVRYFEAGTNGSPFDEGGQIFFHSYGHLIPASARCTVNVCNLFAHEQTARIFALHKGRFTIALRPDFARGDLDMCGPLKGVTLDGSVDLRSLGPDWVLFHTDSHEEAEQAFQWAYELAEASPNS